jgi:hypothetical protein
MRDDPADSLPDRLALRRSVTEKLNADGKEHDAKDPSRQADRHTGWHRTDISGALHRGPHS